MDLLTIPVPGQRKVASPEPPLPVHKHVLMGLVVLLWALPGMFNRDPWKPRENEIVAVLQDMVEMGGDAIPRLLGVPVVDTPPLYFWLGELFVLASPDFIELHEAARLANLALLAVAAACVGVTIAVRSNARFAWDGILLMVGTLGLLFDFHLLNTHLMTMAGISLQLCGLAFFQRQTFTGGALFGIGTAVAFLSAGMLAVNVTALTLLALPLFSRKWLHPSAALSVVVAAFFAVPAIWFWVELAGEQSPGHIEAWLAADRHNWLRAEPDILAGAGRVLGNLTWSAWPTWPIVAIGIVVARRELAVSRTAQIGMAAALAVVACLALSPRHLNSEVFLAYPPLAVVAATALAHLRRNTLSAFDWFALMAISFSVVTMLWAAWFAAVLGWPPAVAEAIGEFRPGVELGASPPKVAVALAATLAWLALLMKINRGIHRPILNWTCGLAVTWLVFCMLWLEHMDAGRSYRGVAAGLKEAHDRLGPEHGEGFCIENANLFVSDLAQFRYFEKVTLLPEGSGCPYALHQLSGEPAGDEGILVGRRPNPDRERFVLRAAGQGAR